MKKLRVIKVIAVALFLISLFCTVDLGLNLIYNSEPSIHDGSYVIKSILHAMFGVFGDSLWSFDMFFLALKASAWITYALLAVNAVLYFIKEKER